MGFIGIIAAVCDEIIIEIICWVFTPVVSELFIELIAAIFIQVIAGITFTCSDDIVLCSWNESPAGRGLECAFENGGCILLFMHFWR